MDLEDIIYFAGLFDGEGTVTLSRRNINEYRSPSLSLASTTEELVIFCKNIFGGYISNKKTTSINHHKSYVWSIGSNKAIEIMELIETYIKEPKKLLRIRYILNNYKKVTIRNGRYTEKEKEIKIKFEEEFFKLGSSTLK